MKKCFAVVLAALMMFSCALPAGADEGYVKMTGLSEYVSALLNKKEIINTKFAGTPSDTVWSADDAYDVADTVVLEKTPGRDFVIMNIADIHFSDYDYRFLFGFSAMRTVRKLVKKYSPDLITVSGDIICGESDVYSVKRFTDFMTSLGVPFAPVFGNHDDEANCDLDYAMETMAKSPYFAGMKGDREMGVGNYVVSICENGVPVHALIMMDSHHGNINEKQIEWYKWVVANNDCETSVMYHIPCAEYVRVYEEGWDAGNKVWREGFGGSGRLHEKICNQQENGLFAAARGLGSTKNILCSHDHMNNFSAVYEGVRLTYMLKVGRSSGYQPGFNGMTKITVDGEGSLGIEHEYVFQPF